MSDDGVDAVRVRARWLRRVACLWLLLALLHGYAAHGQQRGLATIAAASEPRIALVIGNSAYRHIARLANPANDARLIAETLRGVGFQVVGGRPLIDADKPAIEKAVREFGRLLRGGAVGLFYFAGHAIQVKGENYLIPVTANVDDESDVKYELVNAGIVLDEMTNAGNRLNVVILDACRNNPFGGRGVRSASSGLAQVTAPAGTVIGYATQPGNVAADGAGSNSPYTVALARAIRVPGQSLFDTFNAVGVEVKQATGGRQQPWVATSPIEGAFQFVPQGAPPRASATLSPAPGLPAAEAAANDRAFWDSVKDSRNSDELQAYLDRFPEGLFAPLARSRIKAATEGRVEGGRSDATPETARPASAGGGTGLLSMLGSGAPVTAPVGGKGKVHLLRDSALVLAFRNPDIAVDGRLVGELSNGRRLEVEVDAGVRSVSLSLPDFPAATTLRLVVSAGSTHYIGVSPRSGAYNLITGQPNPGPGFSDNPAIVNAGPFTFAILDEAVGRPLLARLTNAQ